VSVEETVVDYSNAKEKLALAKEYFIMDDPEEDFQQTENDINRQLNNKVSPQSTESASPQVGSPSTTAQHCLPTFFTKTEKRPIETGAVSEEANVTVASAAEEKCDLAEEKFVVYLEDFEDDFFIPTDRDESIQIEDEASPIATENSNPQTVKPTTSHQPKGYLATATPTTLTSTDTSPAAAVTEDIKLHIYLKDSTRAKIAKKKI
jgi:hypothetical protein